MGYESPRGYAALAEGFIGALATISVKLRALSM